MSGRNDSKAGGGRGQGGRGPAPSPKIKNSLDKNTTGVVILKVNSGGREAHTFPEWRKTLSAAMSQSPIEILREFAVMVDKLAHPSFPTPPRSARLAELIQQVKVYEVERKAYEESVKKRFEGLYLDGDNEGKPMDPRDYPDWYEGSLVSIEIQMEITDLKNAAKAEAEAAVRTRSAYYKNFAVAFNFILNSISSESKSVLESQAEWVKLQEDKEPLELMRLLIKLHSGAAHERPPTEAQHDANVCYWTLKMRESESVAEFKDRFTNQVTMMSGAGCTIPPDEDQATRFRRALDMSRFGEMEKDVQNDFLRNPVLPDSLSTVEKVKQFASGYKTLRSKPAGGASASAFVAEVPKKAKGKAEDAAASEEKVDKRACFGCGSHDHHLSECPSYLAFKESKKEKRNKKKKEKQEEVAVTIGVSEVFEYEIGDFESTFPIMSAKVFLSKSGEYSSHEVLSDNEATAPLFGNASLLLNLRQCDKPITFRGIGGLRVANMIGDFPPFGHVYYSPDVFVNVLSWSSLQDNGYRLRYRWKCDEFTIQKPGDHDIHVFERRSSGLYSKFFGEVVCSTVAEQMAKYPVRDIKMAEEARNLVRRLGVPAKTDVIKLLNQNSKGGIGLEPRHFDIADDLWGRRVADIAGKSTEPDNQPAKLIAYQPLRGMQLTFHSDIFFVRTDAYLVTVVDPIGLVITNFLGSKSVQSVCASLTDQIMACRRENFSVSAIFFDGERSMGSKAAMKTIEASIQGVGPKVESKPGVHIPKAEIMIKMIKSWCRGILSELWFRLASCHVRHLVTFVTQRINMFASKRGLSGIPAIEAFQGRKVDVDKEAKFCFGEYCHATIPNLGIKKHSVDVPRTHGAIGLFNHNRDGDGVFLSLVSFKAVVRSKFVSLPAPAEVVKQLNDFSSSSESAIDSFEAVDLMTTDDDMSVITPIVPSAISPGSGTAVEDAEIPVVFDVPGSDDAETVFMEPAVPEHVANEVVKPIVPEDVVESYDAGVSIGGADSPGHIADGPGPGAAVGGEAPDVPVAPTASGEVQPFAPDPGIVLTGNRYGLRNRSVPLHDLKAEKALRKERARKSESDQRVLLAFAYNISVKKALKSNFDAAMESMSSEVLQLDQKQVLKPLLWSSLGRKRREKILRSFMFLKEKRNASGIFERLKARLVANGKQQDKSLYDESQISSPTAMLSSILMVVAIAAMERRKVVTLDVTGAYLNAKMPEDGDPVDMLLEPLLARILCAHRPEYSKFLRDDGSMVVQLTKALYGCIESAKLWYDTLRSFLIEIGYAQNLHDECVWNKGAGEDQITVVLYVDDLLITSKSDKLLEEFVAAVEGKFQGATVHHGDRHDYLGMMFDFTVSGEVRVSMSGYEEDVVRCMEVNGVVSTPALPDLFQVDESLPVLEKDEMMKFHSIVAKILYLAKRTRPDLLTTVQFLTKRVGVANTGDWKKLMRLGRYLNGSLGLGIRYVFEQDSVISLSASIDASFAVHEGAKSQSSIVILMGFGPVFTKCSKQKIVTKSSHEAELVALSDGGSQVIWSRNFLIAQGYDLPATEIYQDNQATITSIKKGKPCSDRSRHVDVRLFWLGDRIMSGEIEVEYMPSDDMIADFLTKPLQGERFKLMRKKLLNWYS